MTSSSDLRKRKRIAVHWPLRLSRQPGTTVLETTTENLSSTGLYCISNQPFEVGERLQCEVVIPASSSGSAEPFLRLQCRITITRVENLQNGFGLGCHIEDYALAGFPIDVQA